MRFVNLDDLVAEPACCAGRPVERRPKKSRCATSSVEIAFFVSFVIFVALLFVIFVAFFFWLQYEE